MSKEENVVKYYAICNRLKNVIRKGWKLWNVQRDRIESVAEHIFSTQMLAIAMKHEYQYDVDIMKVVFMLAIHELGEAIIDDLTQFEINENDKEKIEHAAVHEILSGILDGKQIEEDRLKKLFRPYEKGTDGQFGLGLSIVYKVVNTYGYHIEADNLQNGVCFRIWKDLTRTEKREIEKEKRKEERKKAQEKKQEKKEI